jgi:hypothetical protein
MGRVQRPPPLVAVYAFDQTVIPAGSVVTGRVTNIGPVAAKTKILSYVNGNFSPFPTYELEFDSVTFSQWRTAKNCHDRFARNCGGGASDGGKW